MVIAEVDRIQSTVDRSSPFPIEGPAASEDVVADPSRQRNHLPATGQIVKLVTDLPCSQEQPKIKVGVVIAWKVLTARRQVRGASGPGSELGGEKSMRSTLIAFAVASYFVAGMSWADDAVDAGRATFDRICTECHYEDDFSGRSRQEILARIQQVAAGEAEHEVDLSVLSNEEMADLADFFASFK
jgi:mono/diheme cytochrome c family protein